MTSSIVIDALRMAWLKPNPWYVAQQLGHADVPLAFTTFGKSIGPDGQKPKAQGLRLVAC